MTWFEKLVGFEEVNPAYVRNNILIDGVNLISKQNGKSYQFGELEIPTLAELRQKSPSIENFDNKIQVSEIVADVQKLHYQPENQHALFQTASQFNLLEMVGPDVGPERGVGIYELDKTQGPACAIACGAGTIFRNYFAPTNGEIGQSKNNQINCLELIGEELGNQNSQLWQMKNGYALPSQKGLLSINSKLHKLDNASKEELKGKLRIGIQWNSEVTIAEQTQLVSQAYCSALPVAYSQIEIIYWESFARLIFEATYEATLYAGLSNLQKNGYNKVFLTLVGGGAFGNEATWIIDSIRLALDKFKSTPLDIRIVSYGSSSAIVRDLVRLYSRDYGH